MKIEIRKHPSYVDEHGAWNPQLWDWLFRADNGAPIAEAMFSVQRRTDAIHSALLTTGLRLPPRAKGVKSEMRADFPMPRGGSANVYVDYGSGGMVTYAQWLVETELIELVEAS